MEVIISGAGLVIKDDNKEILVGGVNGTRFEKLFQTMKKMDAEYQIKKLGKKCPTCGK